MLRMSWSEATPSQVSTVEDLDLRVHPTRGRECDRFLFRRDRHRDVKLRTLDVEHLGGKPGSDNGIDYCWRIGTQGQQTHAHMMAAS